ncbi:hypothetical protein [Streptomyces sp. NPDC056669]|uniref:hypothetical protein n=1 Tax=Streptomyces sp. NPDC056669 TaxID=3345903 RepID=UPI003676CDCE
MEARHRGIDEAQEPVLSTSAVADLRLCAQLDAGAELAEPEAAGELSAPQPAAALTVAEDIRRFLRRAGQATTKEITAHVRNSRPWAGPWNIGLELSRLLAYGDIVRVRTGLYRPAARDEEHAAG